MTSQATHESQTPRNREPGWRDLLSGVQLVRSLSLSGGVALHAVNLYLSTTILPSVVRDIGGLDYYAWNTTLFVVTSIIGSALASRLLARLGARVGYSSASLLFALGSIICALAPAMGPMLLGRAVQGLGGGLLLSLPYAMIRRLIPEPLWPRAMALLSSMWGIATLLGPAIGGIFAEYGVWRYAFWSLIPFAILFSAAAVPVLPPKEAPKEPPAPIPAPQLALLTLAVLAASWSSLGSRLSLSAFALLIAFALLAGVKYLEGSRSSRLLPENTLTRRSALGALYGMSALLSLTVTCTEIFLPLFLQELHSLSPLRAGYISAILSAGWTIGAVISSGLPQSRLHHVVRAGPALSAIAMLALALLLPRTPAPNSPWPLLLICSALICGGLGVGFSYPHLSARVLQIAPTSEQDIASSSVMTIQLATTAFGAALVGLTVNLASRTGVSEAPDFSNAARWLFLMVFLAPLLCTFALRRFWRAPA